MVVVELVNVCVLVDVIHGWKPIIGYVKFFALSQTFSSGHSNDCKQYLSSTNKTLNSYSLN